MPPGWPRTRARILRRDPVCVLAYPGCTVTSTEVDHGDAGTDADWNLRGVCASCHKQRTQAQAQAAARRARG